MDDLEPTLIFLAACIPFFIGTVWAVLDVAQRNFATFRIKALWWLVASTPFVGFIVYLLFGMRKGKKPGP
jgi:hypothetical protein